jgi:uncharacterized membrane protein YhaH (DUF805 family)
MNVFLIAALVSAIFAFITEVSDEKEILLSVAGWLILTLAFYLASLLFGFAVGAKRQNTP